MNAPVNKKIRFTWIDALKAFAILGILLNHLVETYLPGPWFTNPANDWPGFTERIANVFPKNDNFLVSVIQFLGWLGDSGPGIFILLSGLGLTLSSLSKGTARINIKEFYLRRLWRILPLYMLIHMLVLMAAVFVVPEQIEFGKPKILFSILGLRYTDSLFFYINPSWWFVWLILQLYLVFPFLFNLMKRIRMEYFLILTIGFTFLVRGLAINGYILNDRLYYWMTGLFFGTRLAEFTTGMFLGYLLNQFKQGHFTLPSAGKVFITSLVIYLLGFLSSLTLAGSITSNLLVTLGLSGIFYGIWHFIQLSKLEKLKSRIIWLGINSYGIYLLHQAPLRWIRHSMEGPLQVITGILFVLASIPVAVYLEKFTNKALSAPKYQKLPHRFVRRLAWILGVLSVLILLLLLPIVENTNYLNVFHTGLLIILFVLAYFEFVDKTGLNRYLRLFRWIVISLIIGRLFLFTSDFAVITGIFGLLWLLFSFIVFRIIPRTIHSYIISAMVMAFLFLGIEYYLWKNHPLETSKWGEYPALQKHPTRTYSLKPDLNIRLRYNNYEYRLKTNSFGLACPEIDTSTKAGEDYRILFVGDAFTMPEGMKYEKSYTYLLEEMILRDYPGRTISVINAGVTGYGPKEQLPQMKELCELFDPELVIYQFFINEFSEVALSPEERLKRIGLIKQDMGKRERIFVESQIAAHLNLLKNEYTQSLTHKLSNDSYQKALLKYYETDDTIYYTNERTGLLEQYLDSMKHIAMNYQSGFIILYVPGAIAVSDRQHIEYVPSWYNYRNMDQYDLGLPFERLDSIARENGIQVYDLTGELINNEKQPVYFPRSWHWNEEGHRVAAQSIHRYLKKNRFISLKD